MGRFELGRTLHDLGMTVQAGYAWTSVVFTRYDVAGVAATFTPGAAVLEVNGVTYTATLSVDGLSAWFTLTQGNVATLSDGDRGTALYAGVPFARGMVVVQ